MIATITPLDTGRAVLTVTNARGPATPTAEYDIVNDMGEADRVLDANGHLTKGQRPRWDKIRQDGSRRANLDPR